MFITEGLGFFCLFVLRFLFFRKEGRKGEKHWCVREASISCLWHVPAARGRMQPRHVPLLGNESATFCFLGQYQPTEPHESGESIHFLKSDCSNTLLGNEKRTVFLEVPIYSGGPHALKVEFLKLLRGLFKK